jgi:hypothetical protein
MGGYGPAGVFRQRAGDCEINRVLRADAPVGDTSMRVDAEEGFALCSAACQASAGLSE